ncbi:hypothetical protein [Ramlibacter alkalitolerans]|uniref:Uncharacterized protein n=1 Tax=Ramlibacter alkalitolerans TaxID=2039631 RepID=A0ABS1JUC0_9BURK|nr:hypothetical protein [Ramlibacter alkalitolerans]MBL0427812.1 hypothetical protein [Ramlibacter alkalitolerans]
MRKYLNPVALAVDIALFVVRVTVLPIIEYGLFLCGLAVGVVAGLAKRCFTAAFGAKTDAA